MDRTNRKHVSLAGVDYQLAFHELGRDAYSHDYESLLGAPLNPYVPVEQSSRSDLLLWTQDDWSGGEGLDFWDVNDPTRGGVVGGIGSVDACGRIQGKLTQQPNFTDVSLGGQSTTAASDIKFAVGQSVLWAVFAKKTASSTDASTWTTRTALAFDMRDVAADADACYVLTGDGAGETRIVKLTTSGTTLVLTHSSSNCHSIAISGPFLFIFRNDGRVYKIDITDTGSFPYSNFGTSIYSIGLNTSLDGHEACPTDRGVAIMQSVLGFTEVHEIIGPTWDGQKTWTLPSGFTGWDICFTAGAIWCIGTLGGSGSQLDLYAYPLATGVPVHVGFIDNGQTHTTPIHISAGFPSEVMISVSDDTVFSYNYEDDAITRLTDNAITDITVSDIAFFANKRVVGLKDTVTAFVNTARIIDLDRDTLESSETSLFYSPFWNYGTPGVSKQLNAVEIVGKPISAGSTSMLFEYELDQSGNWVAAGTASSSNFTTGQVRFSITTAASPKSFKKMRYRVTFTGAATELHSIRWEALPSQYLETWNIVVRAKNESSQNHVPGYHRTGQTIRSALRTLTTAGAPVTFKDYYTYGFRQAGTSIDNDVMIAEFQDMGETPNGEGLVSLKLVKVG